MKVKHLYRRFSQVTKQSGNSEVHRSSQMTAFEEINPFTYKVKDEEVYKGLKLGCFHQSSEKNAKALFFFLPDFGVSAKNFGSFFHPFTKDLGIRTYSFDRRGFGMSQGRRGDLVVTDRAFRDHWDFFDSVTFLRGYPQAVPKILVSHGIGSLFAAHLCGQRPGFFKASINISPWLGLQNPPNAFSLAMMKAAAYVPSRSQQEPLQWNKNDYLDKSFVDAVPERDRLYLHDQMTTSSYLKSIELKQMMFEKGREGTLLERIVDPQLFLMPEVSHKRLSKSAVEDVFQQIPARTKRIIPIPQSDHFGLMMADKNAPHVQNEISQWLRTSLLI